MQAEPVAEDAHATTLVSATAWPASPARAICCWGIAAVFIIVHFFLQLSFGVVAGEVRDSFTLDAFQLSMLSGAYFVIYVALQTPAGMLVDRFGPKVLLSIGGIISFIGCLIFAHTTWYWEAIFSRLLMGGGMAFAFISAINIAGKWFPIRYIAFMVGVTEATALLGAILCNLVLAKAITAVSWQQCYFSVGIFVSLLSLITWLLLKDSPHESANKHAKKLNSGRMLENLLLLVKEKNLWLSGIYAGLCYSFVTVYAALWGIPFLIKVHNFEHYSATFASTLIYLGMAAGTPLVTWYFGHGHSALRRMVMSLCPAALLLLVCAVIYIPGLSGNLIFLFHFLFGFASSTLILCYTIASEVSPPRARSTAIGLVNTLALIAAPIFQPIIGFVLECRTGLAANSINSYTTEDYQIALSVIPVTLVLAVIIPLFIKPASMKI